MQAEMKFMILDSNTKRTTMQKIVLSLTLLYSLQLMPSTNEQTPEPVTQDGAIVQAHEAVECSGLLPHMQTLEYILQDAAPEERAAIMGTLWIAVQRGEVNQYNFTQKARSAIQTEVSKKAYQYAQKRLDSPGSIMQSHLQERGVMGCMVNFGLTREAVAPFLGHNLKHRVAREIELPKYNHHRHNAGRWLP